MSEARRGLPLTNSRIEKIFPKLTPAQIGRIRRMDVLVQYSPVMC